jgi:hypothetical protein
MAPMEETQILEPIPLQNLSLLEKTCLNEIKNNFFDELNEMDLQTTPNMPFTTILKSISIDKDAYICIKNEIEKIDKLFTKISCKNI